MSHDGTFPIFSAREKQAFEDREAWWETFTALTKRVGDNNLATSLSNAACEMEMHVTANAHARLVRMLPHLADVVTLAVYPDEVPMPDRFQITGEPWPVTHPRQRTQGEEN
jgi:hypothetical protein